MNGAQLLEPAELAEQGPPEAVRLPLDLIDPSPANPRQTLPEIDALAESIKDFGLLQPVTVRRVENRYELIGGHRRWSAFLLLAEREPYEVRWKSIPAVVRTMDDDRSFLALLSSQVHIQGWKLREEASALERLAVTGMTLKRIGEVLHKTEGWASRRLAVYADPILSALVQTERLAPSVAEELLTVPDHVTKKAMAEQAIGDKWSQAQARAEVAKLRKSSALRRLSKRAQEMHDLLSAIPDGEMPREDGEALVRLARLILKKAKGSAPVIPSMEQARRVAGVRDEPRRTARQKARPKRRMMPLPA